GDDDCTRQRVEDGAKAQLAVGAIVQGSVVHRSHLLAVLTRGLEMIAKCDSSQEDVAIVARARVAGLTIGVSARTITHPARRTRGGAGRGSSPACGSRRRACDTRA